MATVTCGYDPSLEPYPVELKDLLDMPKEEQISPDIIQYNTNQAREAGRILRRTAREGQRITIHAWNSDDGKLYPFFINPGHTQGVDAKFFVDQMKAHGSKTLSDELSRLSPELGKKAHFDFFQINVHI